MMNPLKYLSIILLLCFSVPITSKAQTKDQSEVTAETLLKVSALSIDSAQWCRFDKVVEQTGVFDFKLKKTVLNGSVLDQDRVKLYYYLDTLRQVKVFSKSANNIDYHLTYHDSLVIISFSNFSEDTTRSLFYERRYQITGVILHFIQSNRFFFLGTYYGVWNTELPLFTSIMELNSTLYPQKELRIIYEAPPAKAALIGKYEYSDKQALTNEQIMNIDDHVVFDKDVKWSVILSYFDREVNPNNSCRPYIAPGYLHLPLWRWSGKSRYTCDH